MNLQRKLSGGAEPDPALANPELQALLWLARMRPHLPRIIAAAVALLVVIVLASVWAGSRRAARAGGYADLAKASTVPALTDLAAKASGTPVGEQASLRLASLLYEQANYAEAAKRFQAFLADYPRSPARERGQLGLAYALETTSQLAAAQEAFAKLAPAAATLTVAAEAWVGAARCALALGNAAAAESAFKAAVATGVEGFYKAEALDGLKRLAARAAPAAVPPPAEEKAPAAGSGT